MSESTPDEEVDNLFQEMLGIVSEPLTNGPSEPQTDRLQGEIEETEQQLRSTAGVSLGDPPGGTNSGPHDFPEGIAAVACPNGSSGTLQTGRLTRDYHPGPRDLPRGITAVSSPNGSSGPQTDRWKCRPEQPKEELKALPDTFHYEFLGSEQTYPVIVSAHLNQEHTSKLLKWLRAHIKAMGYSIDDLKGQPPPPPQN